MPSKTEAKAYADKLLEAAREEREITAAHTTRFLTRLYPELANCPAARRRALVRTARQRAWKGKPMQFASAIIVVVTIGWLGALVVGSQHTGPLLWVAMGAVIASQLLQHVETRRHLRAGLDP